MDDTTGRRDLATLSLLVLQLLARGYSPEQIAQILAVSPSTVSQWNEAALHILGTSSPDEAVQIARRLGLIV